MSSVNDISNEYRNKFLKRQLKYDRKFREAFNKIIEQFAALSNDPNAKFTKAFKYNGAVNKKIDVIIEAFNKDLYTLTEDEVVKSWGLSNDKNDLIVKEYIKNISAIKAAQTAKYFMPNIPALKSFISSAHGTNTLAESVWQVTKQARKELEIHLGIGIMNGDSAQVISRRIRQYLKDPGALFRRIRDNNGRLVASKAMIEYRKANGLTQGVYTSAYKNAMRVARTNTNQAYLLADSIRWRQLDMVKGVKISLSAQHVVYDICDELVGIYPKTFIWVGFHPQDLCHATPVMSSQKDFLEYLRGNKPLDTEQITEMPDNFKTYMKANYERFTNYKSMPFFITDNPEIIKNIIK